MDAMILRKETLFVRRSFASFLYSTKRRLNTITVLLLLGQPMFLDTEGKGMR